MPAGDFGQCLCSQDIGDRRGVKRPDRHARCAAFFGIFVVVLFVSLPVLYFVVVLFVLYFCCVWLFCLCFARALLFS